MSDDPKHFQAKWTPVRVKKMRQNKDLIVARDGPVLRLTFNRPHKKNALTGAMYRMLAATLSDAADDPTIGAILFAGTRGVFTAGNDIRDFLAAAESGEELPALGFIRALARCDIPMVAAVDGAAIGLGTTMLFHCDLVYATPSAMFQMPFVDLGLVPEAGASLLVPRRVGLQKATELLLLAEPFDAAEAQSLGLVNALVAPDDLENVALSRAQALAAKPRSALLATRRLIRGDRDVLLARMEDEIRAFAAALASPDARAAFTAFLERGKRD
ncbi:MAG TPA: enoyl-CoA hydratase-related protein [Beijerinckiaceae bacterium]|nr:enoyl-CoA hydratase-related protein [Beijerinckiaceae bacterium]